MRALSIALAAGLLAVQAPIAHAAAETEADKAFKAIYSTEWAWREAQFGGDDDDRGSPTDHLPRVDAATQDARLAYWTDVLKKLDGIDVRALSPEQQINYAIYKIQIDNLAADQRFGTWQAPLNSDTAFWSNLAMGARKPFRTADDYRRYLSQLADMPRYFREEIADMKLGLARGFTPPKVTLEGRDASIAQGAVATEANPFYAPFRDMPASIPADEQAKLEAEGLKAIQQEVAPAHQALLAFFRDDYLPHARTTLAAEALPDGKAFYRQQIREYTTLDMDPEAIHQLGLKEVARIHAEMLETMKQTGFKGDFPAFLHFLRTDPQFYAKTPDDLLMHAAWIAKEVDGKVGQYIGVLPRNRFGIDPVPASIAPYYTAGRGGASTYYVNTYDLPSRPLYNLPALTLHESSPGHSLQPQPGDGAEGPAGLPPRQLHLRLRRGLGAVFGAARRGDGHLPHAL